VEELQAKLVKGVRVRIQDQEVLWPEYRGVTGTVHTDAYTDWVWVSVLVDSIDYPIFFPTKYIDILEDQK